MYLPETKGIPLEQMDDLFTNSPWIVPGSKWKPRIEVDLDALAEKKAEGEGMAELMAETEAKGLTTTVERV